MRTVLFLVAGFSLMAAFLVLAKLFSANYPEATRVATIAFAIVWLVVVSVNMWVGVTKAGYSVAEELPIFVVNFGLPVAVAILLKWKLL